MKSESKGHIALIVSGLMFGANYWIAKSIMPAFTPFQIVAVRIIVVAALLWLAGVFVKTDVKILRKDMLIIFIAGILGISVNQYFFFAGLQYSSPVETSILHTLSPLLVAMFAIWILKEKPGVRKLTGIFSGFVGAIIIILSGKTINLSNLHFTGNLFIILNIFSYSIYLVMIKPIMDKYNSFQVMKYLFLAGAVSYLPLVFFNSQNVSFAHVTSTEWLSLSYVVIVTTLLTYLLTLYAIKRLPATITGFYIYMQPFIAAFIGYFAGNERLSIANVIASFFLFTGVWLVVTGKKREEKQRLPEKQ